ncbi:Uncharacterized protein Rs2_34313 [Raphanus sativus]|nr:Uncharacterized protein Rs2_34313 [Raphanus sativus]
MTQTISPPSLLPREHQSIDRNRDFILDTTPNTDLSSVRECHHRENRDLIQPETHSTKVKPRSHNRALPSLETHRAKHQTPSRTKTTYTGDVKLREPPLPETKADDDGSEETSTS